MMPGMNPMMMMAPWHRATDDQRPSSKRRQKWESHHSYGAHVEIMCTLKISFKGFQGFYHGFYPISLSGRT